MEEDEMTRNRSKRYSDIKMKFNWFNIKNEERSNWEKICPPGEFRIISGNQISSITQILPSDLTKKFDSVFIAGSPVSGGTVYYMANGNRVDTSGSAIDQMPFGLAFIGQSAAGSACLVQHAAYPNRTTIPPAEFWSKVHDSGSANYYQLQELPTVSSGELSVLHIQSQWDAFELLRSQIEPLIQNEEDTKLQNGD